MDSAWRQTVTNQQTILTVVAGLAVPAIVTLMTQDEPLSVSEGRLLTYAIISLAIHIPLLLLTAHNDRRTAFMISQGEGKDPWRIVLSRINNILYPIVNFSVLAPWLFLLLILFNRVNIDHFSYVEFKLIRSYHIAKIDSPWVVLSTIGTFLAVVAAVIGIEEIRSLIFRPRIRPDETKLVRTEHHRQNKTPLIYHRLIVKNVWRWLGRSARDVRVLLSYDRDGLPPSSDFIPVPLRWTYWNSANRGISRGEPAYLDVFEEKQGNIGRQYEFCWADDMAGAGSAEGKLKIFNPYSGNIRLEFYERNGGLIGDMTLKYDKDTDYFEVIDWE